MTLRSALGDAWTSRTPLRLLGLGLVLWALGAGLVLVALLESTYGQPDQRATVTQERLTGERQDCGRGCSCPEERSDLALADGGDGHLLACQERYAVGDVLVVRRQRDEPEVVELAPPSPGEALVTAVVGPPLVLAGAWLVVRLRR